VRWVVNVHEVQEYSGPLHLLGKDEEPVEVVVGQAVILESETFKKRSTKAGITFEKVQADAVLKNVI